MLRIRMLGLPSGNVLAREASVAPKPMKMSVGAALTPCTAGTLTGSPFYRRFFRMFG